MNITCTITICINCTDVPWHIRFEFKQYMILACMRVDVEIIRALYVIALPLESELLLLLRRRVRVLCKTTFDMCHFLKSPLFRCGTHPLSYICIPSILLIMFAERARTRTCKCAAQMMLLCDIRVYKRGRKVCSFNLKF